MGTDGWSAKLRLKLLSPVHIGTGERLNRPQLEYDIRNGRIGRLDIDSFLRDPAIPVDTKEKYFSDSLPKGTQQSLKSRMNILYDLVPASGRQLGKEVREAIKLPTNQAYIPGSSIKGAIRTALAWNLYYHLTSAEKNEVLTFSGNEKRDQFKAGALEGLAFRGSARGDAKADALKSLIVADSGPLENLELRLYDLITKKGGESVRDNRGPFALESIQTGSVVDIQIKVDGHYLKPKEDYKPSENASIILTQPETFVAAITQFGKYVAGQEREFYTGINLKTLASFFEQEDLIPIGFGTGWNAKTLGTFHLKKEEIQKAGIKFRYGSPPPRSRRIAIDADGKPALPIGWVQFMVVM